MPIILDRDPGKFTGGRSRFVIPQGALRVGTKDTKAESEATEPIGAVAATTDGGIQVQIGKVLWYVSFLDLFRYVEAAAKRLPGGSPDDKIKLLTDEVAVLKSQNDVLAGIAKDARKAASKAKQVAKRRGKR